MTDILLAVFTGILALSILTQSVLFLLTFLSFRRLSKDLLPQVQKLTEKTEATFVAITDIAESIKPVAGKLADSVEIIHDVTRRTCNTINILNDGVLAPVSRISAITRAVKIAAGVLFRRR